MRKTLLVLGIAAVVGSQAFWMVPEAGASEAGAKPGTSLEGGQVYYLDAKPVAERSPWAEKVSAAPRGTGPQHCLSLDGTPANSTFALSGTDPDNWISEFNIGANNIVSEVRVSATIEGLAPSWRTESRLGLAIQGATTPAVNIGVSGASFQSPGLVNATGAIPLGTPVNVGASGILRFVRFESYNDPEVTPDSYWHDYVDPGFECAGVQIICSDQAACDAALGGGTPPLTDPEIVVDPAELSSVLEEGANTDAQTLTINNLGETELNWTIVEDGTLTGGLRGTTTLLYDQTSAQTSFGVLSTYDLDEAPDYVTEAADDFVVPAGETWSVDRIVANGFYGSGSSNPASDVNVAIYADSAGAPGSAVASFTDLSPVTDASGVLTFDLPSAVDLGEGTYWVSVQPVMDYFIDGSWYWYSRTDQAGSEFHWRNIGGGFGSGCDDWAPGSSCDFEPSRPDLSFQIYGQSGSGGGACTSPSDIGWLSLSDLSGTTDGLDSSAIDVEFDATGLSVGSYSGNLCISSDDSATPLVVVPVALDVETAAGGSNGIYYSSVLNYPIPAVLDGTTMNLVSETFNDAGPISGDWDLNFWASSGNLQFWSIATQHQSRLVLSGTQVAVLNPGDVVGPSSTFQATSGNAAPVPEWRAGTNAYVGIRFNCDGRLTHPVPSTVCYGYIRLSTTGATGFPATVVEYAFDGDGNAITIPGGGGGGDPEIELDASSFSFSVEAGSNSDSEDLTIRNVGAVGSTLNWSIAEAPRASSVTNVNRPGAIVLGQTQQADPNASLARSGLQAHGLVGLPIADRGSSIVLSQNTSTVPSSLSTVACYNSNNNFTLGNTFLRRFYFNEHPGLESGANITSVDVSVETASGSNVVLTVNLYTVPSSTAVDTIPALGTLTLIGTATATVPDGTALSSVNVPITGAVADTAANDLVVAVSAPSFSGQANNAFFPGSNAAGQTHPGFILSTDCSIANPTTYAGIGFPNVHLILTANAEPAGSVPPSCESPADVAWLTVGNSGGSLASGSSVTSAIGVNSSGLAVGTYTANLCVESDDPVNPLVEVPVSLEVTEGGGGTCDIVEFDDVNLSFLASGIGSSIQWHNGVTCDNCDGAPNNFNIWQTSGQFGFFWPGTATRGGVATGTTYDVLSAGAPVGPTSTFITSLGASNAANWHAGVDGYLGFRFVNPDTSAVNYGYARITTTAGNGYPIVLHSYAFNSAGDPIEVGETCGPVLGDPEIAVNPTSLAITATTGGSASDTLNIANVGGGTLTWDIETDTIFGNGARSHNPALDEVLTIGDFDVDEEGSPQVFTIPAGVATQGQVVGFTFNGEATVIGGGAWASDTRMVLQGPDGSSINVGGFSGVITPWDFQGSGSTSPGVYSSVHDDVWAFPPGIQGDGNWTITFTGDWGNVSWVGVTITLHKAVVPEACEDPNLISWLSVNPAAGSTAGGSSSAVGVDVDASGLSAGVYEAFLCVTSNDSVGNDFVVVPVELTVGAPSITVNPDAIAAAVAVGGSATDTLTIGNVGDGDLHYTIDEAPAGLTNPRAHFPTRERTVPAGRIDTTASASVEKAPAEVLARLAQQAQRYESKSSSARGGAAVTSYSNTGWANTDYVTLDALVPGSLTSIVDPQVNTIYAATFLNNDFSRQFFVAGAPGTGAVLALGAYGYLDTATGTHTQLGVVTTPAGITSWTSAAADPTTGTVYLMGSGGAGVNRLFTINPDTGALSLVGALSGSPAAAAIIVGIAVSPEGLMYALDIGADVLLAIDKTNGAAAAIGALGPNANFAQDIDFDQSTGVLYWPAYLGSGASQMHTINTSTGAATLIGPIENGAELLSFSVAVAGGNCSDPADVPWLSLGSAGGTIAVGGADQNVTVTMNSTGLSDGLYEASVCVRSNDPNRAVVEVPVQFAVGEASGSDLTLSLFGVPSTVNAGSSVSLIATVANFGPSPATDVALELELPAEFDFVSGRLIQGSGDWDCSATGNTVTCELTSGALPTGSFAAVLQVDASVDAGAESGVVQTHGAVSSGSADPNPGNNEATVDTTIIGGPEDAIFANGFECAPGLDGCSTGPTPGVYTDRAAFMANVAAGALQPAFTQTGSISEPAVFSGGGFGISITSGNQNGLYGEPGGIITPNNSGVDLVVDFTSGSVTAVGANFWITNASVAPVSAQVSIELSDGTVETYTATSASDFRGFITAAPITRITFKGTGVASGQWSTLAGVVVGSAQ